MGDCLRHPMTLVTSTAGVHQMRPLYRHSMYHCFHSQQSHSSFENNWGRTDGRTHTTSYRDAQSRLKTEELMTLSYTFNVSLYSLAMPQPLVMSDAIGGDETASVASSTVESVEKRTRFSFSHGDHDSIDAGKRSYGLCLDAFSHLYRSVRPFVRRSHRSF